MATKKQKRLALEKKRADFEEEMRQEGLAAQRADRERREKAAKDAKIKASKDLLEKHEREKQARRDIADAQREFANLTPDQKRMMALAADMMHEEERMDALARNNTEEDQEISA